MKNVLYGLVGTLLYLAPLAAIVMQTLGTKKLCAELQRIRESIENLNEDQKGEAGYLHHSCCDYFDNE